MSVKLIHYILFFVIYSCTSTPNLIEGNNLENYGNNQLYLDFEIIVEPFLNNFDTNNPKQINNLNDMLLIPQEYAFKNSDTLLITKLSNHWNSISTKFETIKILNPRNFGLARLTLIKTASSFLKNIVEYNHDDFIDNNFESLYNFVKSEVIFFSTINNPGWPPLINDNVEARVNYALNNWPNQNANKKNYEFSINDDLWRLVETASNLYYIEKLIYNTNSIEIKKIVDLGYRFVTELGEFDENGWYFQLGSINDHPDNIYSYYNSIIEINGPKTLPNLGWDTSHFSMFPSMLNSLIQSYDLNSAGLLNIIRIELSKTFFQKIINENENGFMTVNYMDGSNGLYRYDPEVNDAYLPYETSGTILFGHWSYLKTNDSKIFYKQLFEKFPLKSNTINLYQSKFKREGRLNEDQVESLYSNSSIRLFSYMASKL